MWIILAICSALGLGFYDVFKKLSVRANNVLLVLMLNTVFGTLLMSPVLVDCLVHGHIGLGDTFVGHARIMLKALIVLGSWLLGYFAIKHLPLTIQGPINASRPVLVLVGAMVVFGERLNLLQWCGILLGFASLFFISRIGAAEGFSLRGSRWAQRPSAPSARYTTNICSAYTARLKCRRGTRSTSASSCARPSCSCAAAHHGPPEWARASSGAGASRAYRCSSPAPTSPISTRCRCPAP